MDADDRRYRASEEAADWWALLQSEELTGAEREAFINWLRDSQTNIAEMLRLAQVHGALAHFRGWNEISTDASGSDAEVIHLSGRTSSNSRSAREEDRGLGRPRRWWLTLAASAAVAAVAAVVLFAPWRGQLIATERGERREVVLDDGSMVQVDPQTRLRVRFEDSTRRVELLQGRALFHVAKNAARPFIVEADDATVRAVGTAFGVEHRDPGVVVVTVAEGKVAVSPAQGTRLPNIVAKAFDPAPAVSANAIYLVADQQVTLHASRKPEPVSTVSSEKELAWAEGRLFFRNDPLSKVVADFNRYNRVQISVPDEVLAARPITGVFDATNPEALIAFMQKAASVHVNRKDAWSIVITREAPP